MLLWQLLYKYYENIVPKLCNFLVNIVQICANIVQTLCKYCAILQCIQNISLQLKRYFDFKTKRHADFWNIESSKIKVKTLKLRDLSYLQ